MKKSNIKQLEKAELLIRTAKNILDAVYLSEEWAGGKSDIGHFKGELADFLSCDHDEAGFSPYLRRIKGE